jgi:hypothetical protein
MSYVIRILGLLLLVVSVPLLGGCGMIVMIERDLLRSELNNSPAELAQLKAQREQLEKDVENAESEIRKASGSKELEMKALNYEFTELDARQNLLQAEIARRTARCQQLDTELVTARAAGAAAQPGAGAPLRPELQDMVVRLARLEDWLANTQAQLRARKADDPVRQALQEQLRGEAYLLAVAWAVQNTDLPAWKLALEQEPALQPAAAYANLVGMEARSLSRSIYRWTDRDNPLLVLRDPKTRFADAPSTALGHLQDYLREVLKLLKDIRTPEARAWTERYQALTEVLRLAEPVVAAEEFGKSFPATDRATHLRALLKLWQARTIVDNSDDGQSASLLQAVAMADFVLGPTWDAQRYLAGRIQTVSAQRQALADMLITPPTVGRRAGAGNGAFLGITSQQADPGKRAGVTVVKLVLNGPAALAGLKEGDVISGWNGKPIADFPALQTQLAASKPGDKVKLTCQRGVQGAFIVEVELGQRLLP